MMGDIVPEDHRGRYFGKRNAILGGVGIVVSLMASFFLDYFKARGIVLIGFSLLLLIALYARIISVFMLKNYNDPDGKLNKLHKDFWQFSKNMHKTNYGKFVIYVTFLNFAAMIASPFFNLYMLQELNLSYVTYTLINLSQSVSMLIFMLVWGKFADKYGNKILLIIGNFLIPLLPLLWIFNQNPFYLFIPMFLGGIGWAAFNLSSSNFVYDLVPHDKRSSYFAYLNVFAGIGIFFGAIFGGFLIKYLNIKFMNVFLFVFLISAIARAIVALAVLPMVKEVRKVEKFSFAKMSPMLHLRASGQQTSLNNHSQVGHHALHV